MTKLVNYDKANKDWLDSWGITPEENDNNLERIENNELVSVWIGCDTNDYQLEDHAERHGEKYTQTSYSGYLSWCNACNGLQNLDVTKVYDGTRINYYLDKKEVDTRLEEVEKELDAKKERTVKQKEEKENKEKQRIEELTRIAKETNEAQIINEWSENCNDMNEECDVDLVHEYILPNGTRKITRSHTW